MVRQACPICSNLLVLPVGPKDASILLIGEYPGVEEVKSGFCWVGRGGEVLRAELARVGIQYEQCRATNLWLHAPSKEDEEYRWHMEQMLTEVQGKKFVLLMGSDVCKALLGEAVSDVSGLIVNSPYLPKDVTAIACKNPALVLRKGTTVGEVRQAMKVFGEVTHAQ